MATLGPQICRTGTNVMGVGTIAWANPDRITGQDSLYASANFSSVQQTNYLEASNFDFSSIPAGSTINGIVVTINRFQSGTYSAITDKVISLILEGSLIGTGKVPPGGSWSPIMPTPVSFGGSSDLWGTSVTLANIQDSTFGVVLSINGAGGLTNVGFVDYISMTITYTPPVLSGAAFLLKMI